MQYVVHTFKPIYNAGSKILILGTMPSPKSREYNFYYSHPQNRFWRILADILNQDCPKTNIEKEDFAEENIDNLISTITDIQLNINMEKAKVKLQEMEQMIKIKKLLNLKY